ncbi:imelysin family protein [Nitratireductor sp. XY-223]|uniref:imelysin family protein n=1 Tax=Nitratireductor sp. XY-223 TaxID=2561926 RepID=UPI00145ACEB5|nr:imelysin family protein [Nitratireductor sp. XY-223]
MPVTPVSNAIARFVLPAYENFSKRSGDLSERIGALCASPSPEGLDEVRSAFSNTVVAMAAVSIVRIGPILEDNRLERLLFWPDRRGIGLRQIQVIIAKQDPTATDPGGLAGKSVAVQGLTALEFVLFGEGAETLEQIPNGYRCRLARSIGTNVSGIAKAVLEEWQAPAGFAHGWQNPGPENSAFRDEKESLSALVSLFANGLEYYDTIELGSFLGVTPEKDRPRRALFHRSGNTLRFLQAGLKDFRELYRTSELAALLPDGSAWIDEAVVFGFRHGIAGLESLSGSAADLIESPQQRSKLVFVRTVVRGLGENFGIDMTAALDLTANFSSLDGD